MKILEWFKLQVLGIYSPSRAMTDPEYAQRVVKRLGYTPREAEVCFCTHAFMEGFMDGIKDTEEVRG